MLDDFMALTESLEFEDAGRRVLSRFERAVPSAAVTLDVSSDAVDGFPRQSWRPSGADLRGWHFGPAPLNGAELLTDHVLLPAGFKTLKDLCRPVRCTEPGTAEVAARLRDRQPQLDTRT